jgi:hypothetical protein
MRAWIAWSVGVALLAAAWLVALVTPPEDAAEAPFPVTADLGEEVSTRTITATVQDARVAEHVTARGWEADGTWVVVDLDVAATTDERGARLRGATLTIGERTYRASERPRSLFEADLRAGIPQRGSLAFEVPAGAADDAAVLRLSEDSETRLDALIEVPVDLGSVEHVTDAELLATDWARS